MDRLKKTLTFLLLAVALTACAVVERAATGLLAPTAESTATPTAPAPSPTAAPFETGGVRQADLLDETRGWALVERGLYWTEDTGAHWRQMTPTLPATTVLGNAFFLDARRLWLLACEPSETDSLVKVIFTTDGGLTWQPRDLAPGAEISTHPDPLLCGRIGAGHLFFLDAQQGWALVDHTETMNSFVAEIFHTTDGGQTWQHLGASPSGELRFVSPADGWLRATCCTGGPFQLYRTRDGGEVWEAVQLPGSGADDDFFLPVFTSAQSAVLPVILRDEGLAKEGVSFYKTGDGGETWELAGRLALVSETLNIGGVLDVTAFDERTWAAAVTGAGVYWTADGGLTWVENTSERSIYRLWLGSPTHAWGLACVQGAVPDCVNLLSTGDMGVRWTPIVLQP